VAQLYSSGPVDVWAGVGVGNTARFLGHGKRAPKIQPLRRYKKVPCDLGGEQTEFDRMFDGQIVRVSMDLVRYHEDTLLLIEDAAATNALEGLPGVDAEGDVGVLMVQEQQTYPLWLRFPYAAKATMRNPANGIMRSGYHFHAASLDTSDVICGTGEPKAHRLVWTCLRVFDPTTGDLDCYDFDLTGLGTID
jgi:hypothetical protein